MKILKILTSLLLNQPFGILEVYYILDVYTCQSQFCVMWDTEDYHHSKSTETGGR